MASTKIRRTTVPNALNPNQRILILPNCNAAAKCPYWLGALNNVTTIGCGINALMFMEEIDENNAQKGFKQALQGKGTPFRHVVKWFDDKVKTLNPSVSVKEITYSIDTLKHLQGFYSSVFNEMPENSCIIVKYNRSIEAQQSKNLTPGHYVVLSKEGVNKLFTYEPLTSTVGKCNRRELKNLTVSNNFFNVMSVNQGYISASILGIYSTMYGGNKEENISKEKVLSDKIFNLELLDDFVEQNNCRRIGGRTIKDNKRNLSKKSKKLKKSKKSKKLKKSKKSKKLKKSKKSKNNTNKSKK